MPWKANPDPSPMGPALIEVDVNGNPVGSHVEDPGAAKFLVAMIGLALTPLLYPLTAFVVVGSALIVSEIVGSVAPTMDELTRLAVVLVPAVVLLVLLMRVEQRMGTWAVYRWTRHALRLLVPGAILNLMVRSDMGLPDPDMTSFVADTLGNSTLLGATIGPMVAMQVLLWFAGWVRSDWHASLEVMKMRAPNLE